MSTFDTTPHTEAPIWPTAIKWGVISGGIGIILMMVMYNMGMMEPGNASGGFISTVISLAIGFLIVYLGIKEYRDSSNGGQLTFGKGIVWSLGFGLIAGLIGAIFSFIFFSFLAPEFISDTLELQMAQMEEQGMGEDELEAAESMTSMFMSPVVFAIFGLLGQIFYAVVEGLIASLILKTK